MNKELIVFISSIAFIFVVICVGLALYKAKVLGKEGSRKFIHIGVSNWIFFWYFGLHSLSLSLIGPIFFIFGNCLFIFSPLKKLLGLDNIKRDMGLVYFPIALTIVILLASLGYIAREYALCATLAMGYGDGMAAVIGSKWGRHKFNAFGNNKSIEGSVAMYINLMIINAIFLPLPFNLVIAIALCATFIEAFIGLGLDNIAVPLCYVLFGLFL